MLLRVHIFDVEHGECNAIETPSGDLILIGAGHNSSTDWRPSKWLLQRNQRPSCVILSNLDRDHLSDLQSFEPNMRPQLIVHNRSVNPDWVEQRKIKESGEVHEGVQTALHWVKNVFTGDTVNLNYGLEIKCFYHPPTKFQDTNNLSIVTFIGYNNVGILFPGDVETAGWKEFLKDATFLEWLKRTNILIAPHHGRSTGYCEDIFTYCKPHAVIISDKSVVHDTQDHDLYSKHCSGLNFGGTERKVLTTRSDGKITIDVPAAGNYTVRIGESY